MRLRAAADADLPAVLRLLRAHEAGSMFPLARLTAAGFGGDDAHALRVWVAEAAGGIAGMIGLSRAGMLLPQWPGAEWDAARAALAGRRVSGVIGPAEQVRPLVAALGLACRPARHDGDETGFALDLADLVMPPGEGRLLRPGPDERALLIAWRAAYLGEIFATPPDEAAAQAPPDVDRWLAGDSHRLLLEGRVPVALSGFNARLPDVVQVGGVYTPPALRGRGHARRAVARHLAEARDGGARRAVLFAVSPAAERAYRAIGFRPAGRMALVLYDAAQEVPRWA